MTHAVRPIRRRRRPHGRAPTPLARYYVLLGPAPAHKDDWPRELRDMIRTDATDIEDTPTRCYWRRIWYFLGIDSGQVWTHAERTNLQRLEKRWRRRALGLDPRWNAGETTKGGRLPAAIEARLETVDEEPDPWQT